MALEQHMKNGPSSQASAQIVIDPIPAVNKAALASIAALPHGGDPNKPCQCERFGSKRP